jgi:hypothetical protein
MYSTHIAPELRRIPGVFFYLIDQDVPLHKHVILGRHRRVCRAGSGHIMEKRV